MNSRIVDLPSLVQPLTEAEFLSCLRQRRPTLVRGGGPQRYETLLDWQALNHLIGSSIYPSDRLQVVRESIPIPATFYVKGGRIEPAALSGLLNEGVSLVFSGLEDFVPRLRTLCDNIAVRTVEQISIAAVVTSEQGGPLDRHFAYEDLVILQIAGAQRWRVYDAPALNPVRGMPAPRDARGGTTFDEMVQEGDFLFVPAGHWHSRDNGPARSLHAKILFDPPNGRHLVAAFAQEWLSEETFRRPLTRHASGESLAAHEDALKAHLVDKVQRWSLAGFLAEAASRLTAAEIRLEGTPETAPVAQLK